MILNISTRMVFILKFTTCFTVYSNINIKTYCPKNTCQQPTSHLVCANLNPHKDKFCNKYKELTLNKNSAEKILSNINKVRGMLAMGKAVGKNKTVLPKAYGMMRLQWDSEFAGLAKYMLKNEKFKDPAYFTMWRQKELESDALIKEDNDSIMKYLGSVEIEDIKRPKFAINPPYLKILRIFNYKVTHIGCSLAECEGDKEVKSVRSYCLLSYKHSESSPLYLTEAPKHGSGLSPRCGCSVGHWESDDCLCEAVIPRTTSTAAYYFPKRASLDNLSELNLMDNYYTESQLEIRQWWATPLLRMHTDPQTSENPIVKRKPNIVMLPVIAVTKYNRDAIPHLRRFNNMSTTSHTKSIHVINFFKEYERDNAHKKSSMKTTTVANTIFHNNNIKLEFKTPDLTTEIFNQNISDYQKLIRRNNNANYYDDIINDNIKDKGNRNIMSPQYILEHQKELTKHNSDKISFSNNNLNTIDKRELANRINGKTQSSRKASTSTIDIDKEFEELRNYLTYKTSHVYRDKLIAKNSHMQQHEPDTISI